MAIKEQSERKNSKREIDLNGPDGNAFVLIGIAKNLCKQLEVDNCPFLYEGKNRKEILEEMQAFDYEHLITTFDKYFGDYVDLQR